MPQHGPIRLNNLTQSTTLKCTVQRQNHWFQSAFGQELLSAEKQTIETLMHAPLDNSSRAHTKGQQSFQIANCYTALVDFGDQLPLIKVVSSPVKPCEPGVILADGVELPLVPDNANLMILHHLCDFSDHPQQVIREAVLSLAPEGKLIVIGFNPLSLWGLWRLFALWFKPMPWRANFIGPRRMSDWLTLLNCKVEQKKFIIYKPAFKQRSLSAKFGFIGTLSERYNLPFGAVYVITATKKTRARISIRSRWRRPELKPLIIPKPSYKNFDRDSQRSSEQKT